MPYGHVPAEGGASGANVSIRRVGMDLVVSWDTGDPPGTAYQVYCNGRLAWHGLATETRLPYPRARCRIELMTVALANRHVDGSSGLPAASSSRVRLTWRGGAYLAADVVGFAVYGGTTPGGAVSYASRLGYVPLSSGTADPGGYGVGGYGYGLYGQAAGDYAWTSPPLAPGSWNFAVKSVDAAGNEGTAATVTVAVDAAPEPPAANSQGLRLSYTYNPSTRVPTLTWLASPSA